mgnify:FL=1
MNRTPSLPRHRMAPGQMTMTLRYDLRVLDGGGRSTPMRAQLTVIDGGTQRTPEPTSIVALRKVA